jgi:hypothetical protein
MALAGDRAPTFDHDLISNKNSATAHVAMSVIFLDRRRANSVIYGL